MRELDGEGLLHDLGNDGGCVGGGLVLRVPEGGCRGS